MKHLLTATSAAAVSMALMVIVPSPSNADIVHLDDVIIQFSLCLGNDCSNGESFGFDTLRLKENNVRIHFDDTSVSASFPRNDWRITINDSGNGGGSYFSIDDATAGRQVFRVDAGAPSNSLYVDAQGDVGIGVANATTDLHVRSGNTPTLRLEQDGSSGFTAQTFDVAANEANFFVRDVTNGSALSFRIEPGADQDSLFIESDNDIGMGTNSPVSALHVRRTAADLGLGSAVTIEQASSTTGPRGLLALRNNGQVYMQLEDTSVVSGGAAAGVWNLQNRGGHFQLTNSVGTGDEFVMDAVGNVTLSGSLTTSGAGACNAGCDRVFDEDYDLPSIEDHAELMYRHGYLPNVGPTPEDSPINITEKVGRVLNELEHAHIYIYRQQQQLDVLEQRLASLEARE